MTKIEFGFGVERDKDGGYITRQQELDALRVIKREAARIYGSYTLVQTYGGWTDPNGKLVEESGYTLFTVQPTVAAAMHYHKQTAKIKDMVGAIKEALRQEAVAVTLAEVRFEIL